MTMLARSTMLVAAVAASLVGAPSAAAAPEDDFCAGMASVGFTADCATLTDLARGVCTELDRGVDVTAVAEQVDRTTKDPTLSNFIVAGAQLYFCPDPAEA